MSIKGRFLRSIRRCIAVILAAVLAFPNTPVAQLAGVGPVTAYASTGYEVLDLGSGVEDAYYINTPTEVTVNPNEGYLVYASTDSVAPDAPEAGAVVTSEDVFKDVATVSVAPNNDGDVTVYWWQAPVFEDEEGGLKYGESADSDSVDLISGSAVFHYDTEAPEITGITVNGAVASQVCDDIDEDTDDKFSRVVNAQDDTVRVTVETDDNDAEIIFSDNADGITEDGAVSGIGSHVITVTVTDKAGNSSQVEKDLDLWIHETATIRPTDITYNGEAVDASDFTISGVVYNENTPALSYSYDGYDPEEGLAPTESGSYYVRASYVIDADHFSLPIISEWALFDIEASTVSVSVPPEAAGDKVYDGQELELFTAGEAEEGGTIYYGVSTSESGDYTYTASIPKKKDAGTYYLKYYAKAADRYNHSDSDPVYLGYVTISKADLSEDDSSLTVSVEENTATLSAVVAGTVEEAGAPDGSITFKVKADDADYADIEDGTISLANGTATTDVVLETGHIYSFRALYEGTNYNDHVLTSDVEVDKKAPVLEAIAEATDTDAATITISSDEDATLYYLVSKSSLDSMVADEVCEAAIGSSILYEAKGRMSITSDEDLVKNLSGLDADHTYYVALVAIDAAGNMSEVKRSEFATDGIVTTATVDINESNLRYLGSVSAAIDDPDANFAGRAVTYIWYVDGEQKSVSTESADSASKLTNSFNNNLADKDFVGKTVKVVVKASGLEDISDESSPVGKAQLTPNLAAESNFIKEYDGTTALEDGDEYSITLDGVAADDEVAVLNDDNLTVAYDSKEVTDSVNPDTKVVAAGIALDPESADYDYYELAAVDAEAVGVINKKVLTEADVETEDLKLSKKTTDPAFTLEGSVVIKAGSVIEGEDVGLVSALTVDEVNLGNTDVWATPGEYAYVTATYTLTGAQAGNYTFKDEDENEVDSIDIEGFTASIVGEVSLPLNSLKAAFTEGVYVKEYDGTAEGNIINKEINVDSLTLTVSASYNYMSSDAGDNIGIRFTGLTAVDGDGKPYTIINAKSLITGLNGSGIKGRINGKKIEAVNILFNNGELDALGFEKEYDGNVIGIDDISSEEAVFAFTDGAVIEGDDISVILTEASCDSDDGAVAEFDDVSATLSLTGAAAGNYGFGDGLESSITIEGLDGKITARKLEFDPLEGSTFEYSEDVTNEVKDYLISRITNAVTGDTFAGFAVKYDDVSTDTVEEGVEITKEGVYEVTVTDAGNDNYTVPDDPVIGTVTVEPIDIGVTAVIKNLNPVNTDLYEYGETLSVKIDVEDTVFAGQTGISYKWVYTEGEEETVISNGTLLENDYTLSSAQPLNDPVLVGKTVSFIAKLDGYAEIRSQEVYIEARTLTLGSLSGAAEKTYDGTDAISDCENLEVEFSGKFGEDDISVKANAGTFASVNAGDAIDVTVADAEDTEGNIIPGFVLDGADKDNYRLPEGALSLTGNGIGIITPVVIDSQDVAQSDGYYLTKKSGETAYTVNEGGEVTIPDTYAVGEDVLILVPNLTASDITFSSGTPEKHGTAGTYDDANVTYTLMLGSDPETAVIAANYSFDNAESVQSVEVSGVKCVVIGALDELDADAVVEAISSEHEENPGLFGKDYDGTDGNSVDATVGAYKVTVDYSYAAPDGGAAGDAGTDLALTATDVKVVLEENDAEYEISDEIKANVIAAFNEADPAFTGTVKQIVLTQDSIKVGDDAAVSTIAFTKPYDGTVLAYTDTEAVLTVASDDVAEGDVLTAEITAFDIDDKAETVNAFDAIVNAKATITISGDKAGNYSFSADSSVQALVVENLSASITPAELEFDDLTESIEYSGSDLASTIKADVADKIKADSLVGEDAIDAGDLTVSFKKVTDDVAGDAITEVTEVGDYNVYVTAVGNPDYQYTANDGMVGTVSVVYGALTATVTVSDGTGEEGAPLVGDDLTASAEGLPDGVTASYAWYYADADLSADPAPTALANSETYTVSPTDFGKALKVVLTDSNETGYTGSITSEATSAVLAKTIVITELVEEVVTFDSLEYDGTVVRNAAIGIADLAEGYTAEAEFTFNAAVVGSVPVSVSEITVKDPDGEQSGAYVIVCNDEELDGLSAVTITKLEKGVSNGADLVYVANGINDLTFDFTDLVDNAVKGLADNGVTPAFGEITVTGDAADAVSAEEETKPRAEIIEGNYVLTYSLTNNARTLNGDKNAVITIPVTDETNYEQSIVTTLTIRPSNLATVEIVSIGTESEVDYGDEITYVVTVNGTAPEEGTITITYYDSEGNRLDAAPTAVGGYKMVAEYQNGNVTGKSSAKHFAIVTAGLEIPELSTDVITYDGSEKSPTFTVGSNSEAGYVISGDESAVNAGTYTLTAALNEYYKWSDDSTADKTLTWTISPGTLTAASFVMTPNSVARGDDEPVISLATVGQDLGEGVTLTAKYVAAGGNVEDAVTYDQITAAGTYDVYVSTNLAGNFEQLANTKLGTALAVSNPSVQTPVADPAGGEYELTQGESLSVTLSTTTEEADIYYTLDGTDPTVESIKYEAPIELTETSTIKAIAVKDGFNNSEVMSETYTITTVIPVSEITLDKESLDMNVEDEAELTATITPDTATNKSVAWTVEPEGIVTLSAATSESGTAVRITAVAEGEVTVTATSAYDATKSKSVTITVSPKPVAVTPVADPAGDEYELTQGESLSVTLSTTTEEADIYYTLDGTDPTVESTKYEAPIELTETSAIKAIAVKDGFNNSEVMTETYTIITHSEHDWTFTGFTWAEDSTSAVADFTCTIGGETGVVVAEMTTKTNGEGENAITRYTAKVVADPDGNVINKSESRYLTANGELTDVTAFNKAAGGSSPGKTISEPTQPMNRQNINLFYTGRDKTIIELALPDGADITKATGKWKKYYEISEEGVVSIKVSGTKDVKNAAKAANSLITIPVFTQVEGSDTVTEIGQFAYSLPVFYKAPSLKLSSTVGTVNKSLKDESGVVAQTLKTKVTEKKSSGAYEALDLDGAILDYAVSGSKSVKPDNITQGDETGEIVITAKDKATGKISVRLDDWIAPVKVKYTVKAVKKNVLTGSVKKIYMNANAATGDSAQEAQLFTLFINGIAELDENDPVSVHYPKNWSKAGLVLEGVEQGKLSDETVKVEFKEGATHKKGTYTVKFTTGSSKTKSSFSLKIIVSKLSLNEKAVNIKKQSGMDITTGQKMVLIPQLKGISGEILDVDIDEASKRNFEVDYNANLNQIYLTPAEGAVLNAKSKYTVKFIVDVDGVICTKTLKRFAISAKKPSVKIASVILPKSKLGKSVLVAETNVLATYKLGGKRFTVDPIEGGVTFPNGTLVSSTDDITGIDGDGWYFDSKTKSYVKYDGESGKILIVTAPGSKKGTVKVNVKFNGNVKVKKSFSIKINKKK